MKLRLALLIMMVFVAACGGGGNAQNGTTAGINGAAQKGPFIKGSTITIQELDSRLSPTGVTFNVQTTDDSGRFSLDSKVQSPYVEVIAEGYYFDEVTGALSSAPLTLRAIAEASSLATVNVNILTTLERNRLVNLMNNGMSFQDAKTRAESDVLQAFHITDGVSRFEAMDISRQGDQNAILLAVSSLLESIAVNQAGASQNTVAQLSQLISDIASDIALNGALTDPTIMSEITDAGVNLDLAGVKANLIKRYNDLGQQVALPDFAQYIDSQGNGIINKNVSTTAPTVSMIGSYGAGPLNSLVLSPSGNKVYVTGVGNKAYADDSYKKLQIIDVSTPTSPVLVGVENSPVKAQFGTYDYPGGWDLQLSGDCSKVYVAEPPGIVQTIDVSNPSSPAVTGAVGVSVGQMTSIVLNKVSGAAYVYNSMGALDILDLSNPASPSLSQNIALPYMQPGLILGLALSNDYQTLYVEAGGRLYLYDVSNPQSPVLISDLGTPILSNEGGGVAISADGSKAFTSFMDFRVIDISNPAAPKTIGISSQYPDAQQIAWKYGIAISPDQKRAYVTHNDTFSVYDLTDLTKPTSIGRYNVPGARNIILSPDGKKVYLATANGLQIWSTGY